MSLITEIRGEIAKLKNRVQELIASESGLDSDIFTVYIDSPEIETITNKDTKVNANIRMKYPNGNQTTCTGKVKWQGSGSIRWPDKNYQLSALTESFSFVTYDASNGAFDLHNLYPMAKTRTWGARNKFVLKRDHMDHTHARNTIAARLWGDVVSTRTPSGDDDAAVLDKLSTLANYGAVDAFPCKVYVNDVYYGLYALGIPKDEKLFGMTDGSTEGFVCGEEWGNGVQFNTSGYHSEPFEFEDGDIGIVTESDYQKYVDDGITPVKAFVVEYNEDNCDWIPGSLNDLRNIVYDYTNYPNGSTFKNAIEEKLDVNSAIDYLLFIRALCMPDNYARNMILATYDGTYWFCSAYDMDTAFGIHWSGEAFHSVSTYATLDGDSYTNSTMRLWKRLISNYPSEIKARWQEMRGHNGALSTANVIDKIVGYCKETPDVLIVKDTSVYNQLFKTAVYPNVPSSGASNIFQMITWYQEHSKLLDESIDQLGT